MRVNFSFFHTVDYVPDDVIAALWLEPQATSRTLLAFKASTSLGFSQDSLEQWPNLPSSPSPHEKTANVKLLVSKIGFS